MMVIYIRQRYKYIFRILFLATLLVLSSSFAASTSAAQTYDHAESVQEKNEHYYDMDSTEIGIVYDENKELTNSTGQSIAHSLSLLTPDVFDHPVESYAEIKEVMAEEYDLVIYVLDSDHESLKIGLNDEQENISLLVFSQDLLQYESIDHVFAMGNSKQIMELTNNATNIHGSYEDKVDAKHMYIYSLWTIADVLEDKSDQSAKNLAEDIRRATLQYFSNNFNDLISRNIKPTNPMGKVDPKVKDARKENYFEEHPGQITPQARDGYEIDNDTGREINPETGEFTDDYGMTLLPDDAITPTDFILTSLPQNSGLRGPIGGIVDSLLNFVINNFASEIGLSSDTIQNIANSLLQIPDLIGAVEDPSSSKMKQFLDDLKPMLPIPADKTQYFDLVIDALFLMRGDFSDIKNFILSTVDMLAPDLDIAGISLQSLLSDLINLGDEVLTDVQNAENPIDIVLNILNKKIVANLTSVLMENITQTIDITTQDAQEIITKTTGFINNTFTVIKSKNFTSFIDIYGPKMLEAFGVPQAAINVTMEGVDVLLIALGLEDTRKLEDAITEFFDTLYDEVGDQTSATRQDFKDVAKEIVDLIAEAKENGVPSISDFRDNIVTELSQLDLPQEVQEGIEKLSLLILAVTSDDFSITDLGDVFDVSTMITDLLNGIGVISSQTQVRINQLTVGLLGVIQLIRDPPGIEEILGNLLEGIDLTELIQKIAILIIESYSDNISILDASILFASTDFESIYPESYQLVQVVSDGIGNIIKIISSSEDNAIEGILLTLLHSGTFVFSQFTDIDIQAYIELAKGIFGQIIGLTEDPPTLTEIMENIGPYVRQTVDIDKIEQVVSFILDIRDIFTNGFQTIFSKLTEWLTGQVEELIGSLSSEIESILGDEEWNLLDLDMPIGIGSFSLFTISMELGLSPGFEFDAEAFGNIIYDLVFKGISVFKEGANVFEVFNKALSFFSIHPILNAEFALSDFGSESNGFLNFMLQAMGVELSFSGSGFFGLSIFSFQNGVFSTDQFLKILEWGFSFTIEVSRTFTVIDFLTGGAGGGLNAIGKYIGLDAITITIAFILALDIIKRAATANRPETGSMTITIGIEFTVQLAIDIAIATLKLAGTLAITLTLLQDLVSPTPMRVFISIQLIITALIDFNVWTWDFEFKWSPPGFAPPKGYEITPGSPEEAQEQGALGGDSDNDGLGDTLESTTPGLNPNMADTDGDMLSDKYESQTLGTDPTSKDSDQDGLNDKVELDMKSNPLAKDSDFDGLDDFEEATIYGTDVNSPDTDEDGLTDKYEVNHVYNLTGITPTVDNVTIGGENYNDRTDPLNPDTDGDGLLDGQEGPNGINYGPELYNQTEIEQGGTDAPLIFNNGYTSPLDADTDDDSYQQLYDGSIMPVEDPFIMDMNDYREVHGIEVVFYDPDTGEPLPPKLVRTNPVNPDTDGDTGIDEEDRENPPPGEPLKGDGLELATDPPSDPLDGDTDDDGLLDGLEGFTKSDSNHTHYNNPDTDGDGLGDMQELQLGTDPRSIDSDFDGVTDGDEYFIFGTNPFIADTDSDGIQDDDELYLYHSSPFLKDSDGDGINDFDEVYKYFSKPSDEDSDNDGLTDYEEIVIHYTSPFDEDTDNDGLFDGEEVEGLNYTKNGTSYTIYTDPLKWDTDGDSITQLDQDGQMSQPMSDYDEWQLGTDPTSVDTDLDGIKDGWEMWLGRGKIPDFEPMHLDPTSEDTDSDGLIDGRELVIANRSTLLHPYVGFYLKEPLNSSAVKFDTDNDGLNDSIEVDIGSAPNHNDTDRDNLTDYDEYVIHNTSPTRADTDGDNLNDNMEINGFSFTDTGIATDQSTTLFTDPNNSDSDGDLLPDGAEFFNYSQNPTNPDENNNDILDGLEIDSDGDGVWDGDEFYTYKTVESPYGGGIHDPDSDDDGLFDGLEINQVGTSATDWDTDNDTYSDALEYYCETDPLDNSTNEAEFDGCFVDELSNATIISPRNNTEYTDNEIQVIVFDPSGEVANMDYRYKEMGGSYSTATELNESEEIDNYFVSDPISLPLENKSYVIQVTIEYSDGDIQTLESQFSINISPSLINIESPRNRNYEFTDRTPILPVEVETGLSVVSVNFSIVSTDGTILVENQTLEYRPGRQSYYLNNFTFPENSNEYTITAYGIQSNGHIVVDQQTFGIIYQETQEEGANPIVIGAVAFGGGIAATGVAIGVRRTGIIGGT